MSLIVVAFPKVSAEDAMWIREYRRNHDPRFFTIVEPHFTLVFPIDGIPQDVFVHEVEQLSKGFKGCNFTIRVATVIQDKIEGYYHEFLIPDEGFSNMVKMHDALYAGIFMPHLRFDIDYTPHIGIGNADALEECKDRVDALNADNIHIAGTIDSIDIIEYTGGPVQPISTIALQ